MKNKFFMNKNILLTFLFFTSIQLLDVRFTNAHESRLVPAYRPKNKSFQGIILEYQLANKNRFYEFSGQSEKLDTTSDTDQTAISLSKKLDEWPLTSAPAWSDIVKQSNNPVVITNNNPITPFDIFKYIRDVRFLEDPSFPQFLRRISWLYPDDGCFVRADLAAKKISTDRQMTLGKVFVFGDLWVKSNNTPEGSTTWWYHVALTYQDQGHFYVLDPAVEPTRILEIKEWQRLLNYDGTKYLNDDEISQKTIRYAFCTTGAYQPFHTCVGAPGVELDKAVTDELDYLDLERTRLKDLNRNPDEELGDSPPWLRH